MSHHDANPTTTHMLAARHEALWLKLTALHGQIAAVANRQPQAPVSARTISVAEALLREAMPFVPKGDPLPMAAPDHGGLLTQLGQALAAMDYWEASRSRWDDQAKAYLWQVKGDGTLPVRRLRPKLVMGPASGETDPARAAKMLDLREKLAKRLEQFSRR